MFVTLSRRSNSLVNQQLAQIERLEHDEEDPKRLESLFRLDHLASRMRRTADSLLILADAPNRAAGTFSLTVGEALQAATSGVQDYQRVQILSHLGTRVGDEAAADVVHLLTELVDNALTYSPPAEPVRLAAKLGADGVTITITDSGLGVPPAELEQLNRDLAHGAEATPDTARRMGLFVVSRLAERHGITASLARNPGGGMTATVLLPPSVLPELPQTAAPAAAAPAAAVAATTATTTSEVAAEEPKRDSRKLTRAEKAQAKAAEKAAEKQAATEAKAADRARAAEARAAKKEAAEESVLEPKAAEAPAAAAAGSDAASDATQAGTSGRPSLESLLPRREPGANMPRTGADAFLPPETSGATGPLFGKRPEPAADAAAADSTEPAAEPTTAEKVAPVVPITALASRQRAQAEEARVAEPTPEPAAEEPAAEAAVESPVEEPARASDPLSDPLPADAFDEAGEQVAEVPADQPADDVAEAETPAPEAEVADTEPDTETDTETEPETPAAQGDDVEVDAADPLGLGGPSRPDGEPEPQLEAEPAAGASRPEVTETSGVSEPEAPAEEPAAEVTEEPAVPAVEAPAASLAADHGSNGHGSLSGNGHAPARHGGDSPIFKSMRSGWLTGDATEIHETEVDRGWEIAEHVATEAPAAESTVTGLPRRAPGERLVPGSVTPPTAAKTRDPEAIRRRLQAHTAGVSRGRRAAQSSTQHTEAGPA
jgi:anti-sigma regulatory factor (Ser/Thr protein kinase)